MAYLVLLDGSKGAGKTTVGQLLGEKLGDLIFVSLDDEKRILLNQDRSRAELFKEAFANLIEKCSHYLDRGISPVIDCGLTIERLSAIDALAVHKKSKTHKILLKASYETQLARVRSRDSAKGNETDEDRFAEVHALIHAKKFDDFFIIETDQLKPEDIVEKITTLLKS